MKIISFFLSLTAYIYATAIQIAHYSPSKAQGDIKVLKAQFKRPTYITFPVSAPYSPQLATLGKMLFFDTRLSGTQNMSCATCHNPSFGWETPVAKAIGTKNIALDRHAPTLLNLYNASQFFWDGRAYSLEEQAAGPITHPKEMGASFPDLIARLSQIDGYKYWFNEIFPIQGISKQNILTAIATFERTLVSGWAPFDQWVSGDETAISESAKRGFKIFTGKGNCSSCHTGWNFTDHLLHDIGIATNDLGAAALAPNKKHLKHAFKTPTLRNISLRAPYMHDGNLSNLEDVIEHYNYGGVDRLSKSNLIKKINLSEEEKDNLVAFLNSLTEPNPNIKAPALPPR